MVKPDPILCKQVLIKGQGTCGDKDLLTKCKEWSTKFKSWCVTKRVITDMQKAKAENLKFKKALLRENDKEIRTKMDKLSKVQDLKMPTTKRERNYLKGMNMMDAQVSYRYRWKTTAQTNGNTSLMYKDNMQFRLCNSGEDETQEHSEKYYFTREMRNVLPIPRNETCPWSREGNKTHAVKAFSARNISVGAVTCDCPL